MTGEYHSFGEKDSLKNSRAVWRKLFGWKVGDKCAVQLKTKKVYGTIVQIAHVTVIPYGTDMPSAVVEYETKSPIPHRQVLPLCDLLEDDRDG